MGRTPWLEVVSWKGQFPDPDVKPTQKRLRVDAVPIWCHWLDESQYKAVQDLTDYTHPEGELGHAADLLRAARLLAADDR
jgi:hypothetical protein